MASHLHYDSQQNEEYKSREYNSPSSDDATTFLMRFLREFLASRSFWTDGSDWGCLTSRVDFLVSLSTGEASLEKSEPIESSKSTRDVDGS